MNGAESLITTLIAGGIDTCFTNPGTSEMHLVAALDKQPELHCVLGLFEGVVTGAADGYGRMTEKPACTLLHLGPGLANGLANLHNANRAHVPIVNIVGQHASYHLRHNAPLTSDIEGIARPVSNWVRTSCTASEIPHDVVDAIIAARTAPGQIATLIVPAEAAWNQGGTIPAFPDLAKSPVPANETVERAVAMLRSGARTAILLDGEGLYGKGLQEAGRIASATSAALLSPYPFKRMERGAGKPLVERIPYVLEQAAERLKEFRQIILVGASTPVSYFAAPGKNSVPTAPNCEIHALARPGEDLIAGLKSLSSALGLKESPGIVEKLNQPAAPSGAITLLGLANTVAAVLPENTIVVDESMTSGHGMMLATKGCPQHDWLANTGGSIGIAMPMAVGAAVACPNRRVLCLSADGSGMYTAQALWTMAREGLKVTTVIFANRAYGVLKREFSYLGIGDPGPRALDLFEIGRPDLDWVALAKGMGVPGSRVTSLESFGNALQNGFACQGPTLIEVGL